MHYKCPELSLLNNISHGFFTRLGGVSDGIYNSLNCGYGSGDDYDKVSKNRQVVVNEMGGGELCGLYQVHSADVVKVDKVWKHEDAPQADAMVTNKPNIILGVLTADCLPILFADRKNGVIAAAHSGWKGAFSGIIENAVEVMRELGARVEDIVATIGPAIGRDSYEVGKEFYDRFMEQNADNKEFFVSCCRQHSRSTGSCAYLRDPAQPDGLRDDVEQKYLFDLPVYAADKLKKTGIVSVNSVARDTYLNNNEFFSYRRSCKRGEKVYGRQISVIKLNK
ncbi:MAG: peptidoglycan editing factor PgeF [Rickettsiales bacterium]